VFPYKCYTFVHYSFLPRSCSYVGQRVFRMNLLPR
jgi:hypothetical protein